MAPKYTCPACQQELTGRVCSDPDCQCDLDVLFKDLRFDPERLNEVLRAHGVFYDTGSSCIVLPRAEGIPAIECPMGNQGQGLEPLLWWFITEQGYPRAKFTAPYLKAYLSMFGAQRLEVPWVDGYGDRPQLYMIDGKLTWPNPETVASRLIPEGRFYYTGPVLHPKRTGKFDEFLDTLKYRDEESRMVIKSWMVGALLQPLYPAGGAPMLLLAAAANSIGKSATAEMLGHIMGGSVLVNWPEIKDMDGFNRQVMDPRCRTVIFDNLSPEPGHLLIHAPGMATRLTNSQIRVKTLFQTKGFTVVPNRFLYMATGNKPVLACELFARSMVASLDDSKPSIDNWERDWTAARVELLEDLMAEVLENWAKGPVATPNMPPNYRFIDWYHAVTRGLQQEPVIYPRNMVITPPLDFALELVLSNHPENEVPLDEALESLNTSPSRSVKEIMAQQDWTHKKIREELAMYNSKFEVIDIGGVLCVKQKCGSLLPQTLSK